MDFELETALKNTGWELVDCHASIEVKEITGKRFCKRWQWEHVERNKPKAIDWKQCTWTDLEHDLRQDRKGWATSQRYINGKRRIFIKDSDLSVR